uniref:Cyclin N-terminal domain-containing protein n=1 Tax=Rhodosorus marinus TaxID=101924 RepID=A0A7S2ZMC8_9RHOD|mmetsp:Transcript_23433/g.93030  ORF Transcript_23433/g.93030 Transcript_23433/m.93030 type:complete len:277 (+) Transcript_23433:408-1238(+)
MLRENLMQSLPALFLTPKAKSLVDSEEALIAVVSHSLEKQVAANDTDDTTSARTTIFHSVTPPSMSIGDYAHRIGRHTPCSKVCFLGALLLLERLRAIHPSMQLNPLNAHRMFLAAVTVSAKFFDDEVCKNSLLAFIGGVPKSELNALEITFLALLQHRLFVVNEALEEFESSLITAVMTGRDDKSFKVQRTLLRCGCVKPYSLYGDRRGNEFCTEKDSVYVPSAGDKSKTQAVLDPIGEDRPGRQRSTKFVERSSRQDKFLTQTRALVPVQYDHN